MTKLRVCLVSSEIAPFAKTGGLADVTAGLSRYLDAAGHDVRLFMPHYRSVDLAGAETDPSPKLDGVELAFGEQRFAFSVSTTPLPDSGADVYLLSCPGLYDRESIYTADGDEHLRFAALGRAAVECCQRMQWAPDVFHCNDWHTGLLPLDLATRYAWDELFAGSRTLLTIHNIGYQGVFSNDVLEELGLAGQRHYLPDAGGVNFLKTGVMHADALSTVSRTYAREIQGSELGMGLEGLLTQHRDKLVGIVNGVDYGDWNPETDTLIPHRYGRDDLSGKADNKRDLLSEFDVAVEPGVPLIGLVSRLTYQKGLELLPEVIPALMRRHAFQLAVLGSGEPQYERYFQSLRDQHPARVAFFRGYNNELAHRIEAASDLFLMPSRYEPCGLNQMYSMKYGTVPVVRRTGGLADTVEPFDPSTGRGTGFLFDEFSAEALFAELSRAIGLFADRRAWERLVQNGMAQDFSWDRQGPLYVELYRAMLGTIETGESAGG